jgi:hypothetical protein
MSRLYVSITCLAYMSLAYMSLAFMSCFYVSLICLAYMSRLYVSLICLPYMSSLYVFLVCLLLILTAAVLRRAHFDCSSVPLRRAAAAKRCPQPLMLPSTLNAALNP